MKPLAEFFKKNTYSCWQIQLKHSLNDVKAVLGQLELTDKQNQQCLEASVKFPFKVTPYYLSLVKNWNLKDPIIQQILPNYHEINYHECGSEDPLAEEIDSPSPGLTHRYPDRALLVLTNNCAANCRHCMRKRYWGTAQVLTRPNLQLALDYLEKTAEIREVLISGGDPLLINPNYLFEIIERIASLPNIEMVRIGSRLPVVLPQRFTVDFCQRLADCGCPIWLATHFNHPQEITAESALAVNNLLKAGIVTINQTVLLKGVNDDAKILKKLFTELLKIKIKPYYLFHGDPVYGTMHFRTGVSKGLEIMDELRGNMSGLALPAFAIDLPEGQGKVRLMPNSTSLNSTEIMYKSYQGNICKYPEPLLK